MGVELVFDGYFGLDGQHKRIILLSSYFHCNIAVAEGDNSCCQLNSANSLFYSVTPPVILALLLWVSVLAHHLSRHKNFDKLRTKKKKKKKNSSPVPCCTLR
jgi:UDP-2,3-diacylglucosamine pyrophosphatase LpxH